MISVLLKVPFYTSWTSPRVLEVITSDKDAQCTHTRARYSRNTWREGISATCTSRPYPSPHNTIMESCAAWVPAQIFLFSSLRNQPGIINKHSFLFCKQLHIALKNMVDWKGIGYLIKPTFFSLKKNHHNTNKQKTTPKPNKPQNKTPYHTYAHWQT